MGNDIVLDPRSAQLLERYRQRPAHAVLLEGMMGVGLLTVAQELARATVAAPTDIKLVAPVNGLIAIDEVRTLYAATRAARTSAYVVVIDDADAMSREAQNALLKLLEEPPQQVYFIMTTHSPQALLPTILSRTERITLHNLSRQATIDFLAKHQVTDPAQQARLLFLAQGRPAELHRLIHDQAYYDRASAAIGDAKRFINSDSYERLLIATPYVGQRDQAQLFLSMVGKLLGYSFGREVSDNSLRAIEAVNDALDALSHNGNVRLQLLRVSDRIS